MAETLVYECSPRPFFVPPRVPGHRERVGSFDVIEYRRRSKVRPYGLKMECQVSTREEASSRHSEALQLASDLNTVWAYVAGVPLFPKRLVLQLADSPKGWRTNFKKVESTLPSTSQITFGGVSITEGHYSITIPHMPLQYAVAALKAYRATTKNTRFLIHLHFAAMGQPGTQSGLFLFAKALELARAMLPGRNDRQREGALSKDARSELRQSLHWLYGIANERLEIRHVIDKNNPGNLLPKLSSKERGDFLHDADLVIRGVVQRELGLPLAIAR